MPVSQMPDLQGARCLQAIETRRPKEKEQCLEQALNAAVTDGARQAIVSRLLCVMLYETLQKGAVCTSVFVKGMISSAARD